MSYLEDLVGRPLHEVSDAELEEIIMTGRSARENESNTYTSKRTKSSTQKKSPAPLKIPDMLLDLDEEMDDFPE